MFLVARNRNSAQRREEIIPLRVALTKPAGYHPRLGQTRQKWTCTCVTLVREPEPENVSRLSLMKEQLLPGVSDASFCLKKNKSQMKHNFWNKGTVGKGRGKKRAASPMSCTEQLATQRCPGASERRGKFKGLTAKKLFCWVWNLIFMLISCKTGRK